MAAADCRENAKNPQTALDKGRRSLTRCNLGRRHKPSAPALVQKLERQMKALDPAGSGCWLVCS